jgi:hypothetical protein
MRIKEMVIMRNIFLSFTRTLSLMAKGTVTAPDFEGALFYFGCARVHTFEADPEELGSAFGEDRMEEGREALHQLQDALDAAEKQGRVAWRSQKGNRSLQQLSELLTANKVFPLNPNLLSSVDAEYLANAIVAANTLTGTEILRPVY